MKLRRHAVFFRHTLQAGEDYASHRLENDKQMNVAKTLYVFILALYKFAGPAGPGHVRSSRTGLLLYCLYFALFNWGRSLGGSARDGTPLNLGSMPVGVTRTKCDKTRPC